MHHVGGHPHAGVVVQPTAGDQLLLEAIHAGQTGAAFTDVVGQAAGVGGRVMAGVELFLVVMDGIA